MSDKVTPIKKSIREQAEAEVAAERSAAALAGMKKLMRQRADAAQVLANIDREIADYELAIEQGNA